MLDWYKNDDAVAAVATPDPIDQFAPNTQFADEENPPLLIESAPDVNWDVTAVSCPLALIAAIVLVPVTERVPRMLTAPAVLTVRALVPAVVCKANPPEVVRITVV